MGRSRKRVARAARMQPPLLSIGKQFWLGPGQRARQPAYLGAHRELFTYLFWAAAAVSIRRDVPAELMSFCIKVRGVTTAFERQRRRAARNNILRRAREL